MRPAKSMEGNRIQAVVVGHIDSIRRLADVARLAEVGEERLRKAFAREQGESLSAFIRRMRVEKAKELLRTTTIPCWKVSELVGWARVDHAARTFKRETGVTMIQFRRGEVEKTSGST